MAETQGYLGAASAVKPEKIAALAALEEGWDSYGAAPVTQAALDVVRCIAVVPTVNGGVQVEWHANGWEVEIEVDPDGEVRSVMVDKTGSKSSFPADSSG